MDQLKIVTDDCKRKKKKERKKERKEERKKEDKKEKLKLFPLITLIKNISFIEE